MDELTPYLLRDHRTEDFPWIIRRHSEIYAQEFGWNHRFAEVVDDVVRQFARSYDPACERCWIAEISGQRAGSIILAKSADAGVGKLRMLLVEQQARGMGLGCRLVTECIQRAHQSGYQKLTLWTMDILTSARRLYERAGFQLTSRSPHTEFGRAMMEETWELDLAEYARSQAARSQGL